MSLQLFCQNLQEAAACLRNGRVLIFPTETFYGLGCLATDAAAVNAVYQLKRRPVHKPLLLLAADVEQVRAVADLAAMPKALAFFWPGPLTVLLPAKDSLPPALVNERGQVAVRVTSHPVAAALAREAGGPVTASSANLNGEPPVCEVEKLASGLLEALKNRGQVPCVFTGDPRPQGGLPSTLVEPLADAGGAAEVRTQRLRIIRAGAVSQKILEYAGFIVEP